MSAIKVNNIFRGIIYLLVIVILIFLVSSLFGYNLTSKIKDVEKDLTSKEISTYYDCSGELEKYTQAYGDNYEFSLRIYLETKCNRICEDQEDSYNPFNADYISCTNQTLTCLCYKE